MKYRIVIQRTDIEIIKTYIKAHHHPKTLSVPCSVHLYSAASGMQVTTCPVEYRQGSNFEEVRVHEARSAAPRRATIIEKRKRTTASSKRARVLGERRRKEKWSPF